MFYLFLALLVGIGVPIQTAINSRLRSYVVSPYVASFISFAIGTIFLGILTLATKHTVLIPQEIFTEHPWWIWLGGLLGVIGLTTNILLFPKLGGVQTVILPIVGQIFMSMLIDNFGLFHSPEQPFTFIRGIGVLTLVLGVICVIVLPSIRKKKVMHTGEDKPTSLLPFQLFGIFAGMLMASQSAINGHLGGLLHSPIHAAFVSFVVGVTALFIITGIILRQLGNIKFAIGGDKPWWIWLGGILGAGFVLGMAFLVPHIGTGLVVVCGLFGQIFCSILIDKFGLFGAYRKNITPVQVLGLVFMVVGVALIKLF